LAISHTANNGVKTSVHFRTDSPVLILTKLVNSSSGTFVNSRSAKPRRLLKNERLDDTCRAWIERPLGKPEWDSAEVITEHALLPVIPGREVEFELAFTDARAIILSMPGCCSLTLLRSIERSAK
jgi:hypothetical protein